VYVNICQYFLRKVYSNNISLSDSKRASTERNRFLWKKKIQIQCRQHYNQKMLQQSILPEICQKYTTKAYLQLVKFVKSTQQRHTSDFILWWSATAIISAKASQTKLQPRLHSFNCQYKSLQLQASNHNFKV
jgi:hypothetical protein